MTITTVEEFKMKKVAHYLGNIVHAQVRIVEGLIADQENPEQNLTIESFSDFLRRDKKTFPADYDNADQLEKFITKLNIQSLIDKIETQTKDWERNLRGIVRAATNKTDELTKLMTEIEQYTKQFREEAKLDRR